jgi:predicted nucleic acid-binding protein
MRVVVDTGVLVSYVIRPTFPSADATLLGSEQTLGELIGVNNALALGTKQI